MVINANNMKEIFDYMKEYNKEQKQLRNEKYLPIILELGAIQKSDGVYELKDKKGQDWFVYPTKGFCMHKKNSKKRISVNDFIKNLLTK